MDDPAAISAKKILEAVDGIIDAIADNHRQTASLSVVGIANGGIGLGRHIATCLGAILDREVPYGTVDITFHRDDIGHQPITKISFPTELPFSVDDQTVILVDDVLFTGRTARAAINELFDQGRPAAIDLAVLVDRRQVLLPIAATYSGFTLSIPEDQIIQLTLDPEHLEDAELTVETN